MKQAAAILEPHGAAVNLPLTQPGNRREPRGAATKFLYPSGSRPLDGYTIKRGIGRGGFGEVYYATSDGGKEVALKLIRRNLDVELRGVAQCINLKHPNLLALFDIRRDADDDTWVVMEYVGGDTLDQVIARHPHGMPLADVLAWFGGIAAGVAYLHDHGIVHRDLKPGNIFCDEGIIKLGDYGLSKFISASRRSGQTESVGTVHYMAPEVANGRYGKEIDIYALGVILYEMLTGHVPFEGESVGEVLMKHLTATPDLTSVAEPFRSLLARILDKDPARRPQSVAEVLAAMPQAPAAGPGYVLPPAASTPAAPTSAAQPPPLPQVAIYSPADEEPVWKAVKKITRELHNAWQGANLSTLDRVGIIILALFALASTSGLWIALAVLYGIYRIGRAIVLSFFNKPSVVWVAAPVMPPPEARPPTASPAPPVGTVGERRDVPPGPSPNLQPVKSPRDKLAELLGSFIAAALIALAACFVIESTFVDLDWGQFAWLTLVSTGGAWIVLVLAKLWEGTAGEEMQRRFVLLLAGLALGFYAWTLDRALLVNLPYSTNPHLRNSQQFVRTGSPQIHNPFEKQQYDSYGHPTLPAFLAYFGFLLPVLRWWQLVDPARRRRLNLWRTGGYALWAYILSCFWPFPEFGIAAATVIALSTQLASPWTGPESQAHWHRG